MVSVHDYEQKWAKAGPLRKNSVKARAGGLGFNPLPITRFRRISSAIEEARPPSAETSAAEDKSANEITHDHKDQGIEMAVYKLSEKETVAFAKSPVSV